LTAPSEREAAARFPTSSTTAPVDDRIERDEDVFLLGQNGRPMTLNVKNKEAHRLAKELAKLSGEP
jgi:hypothetical protein